MKVYIPENEYGIAAHWLYDRKRRGEAVSGKKLAKEIEKIHQYTAVRLT